MARARCVLPIVIALSAAACGSGKGPAGARKIDAGSSKFGRVASIVIENCAVAGCHDSTTTQHAMDLSTPDKIYDAWVGVPGYDHCTLLMVRRIAPGDPEMSLVIQKVEGLAVCESSRRMPPPPKPALTAEQIETIRVWIAAGAPRVDPPAGADARDGGAGDAPAVDGSSTSDAAADLEPDPDADPDASVPGCTMTSRCLPYQACVGEACDMPWECIEHFDETLKHPCSEEIVPFCGCDGVTFFASLTCPDRPYDHFGACDDPDSFNCDPGDVRCTAPAPVCGPGLVPSVVSGCYGACVPHASCRCQSGWQCPQGDTYGCYGTAMRCHTFPLPTTQPDAGPPDAALP
jgi:hypothetical protein